MCRFTIAIFSLYRFVKKQEASRLLSKFWMKAPLGKKTREALKSCQEVQLPQKYYIINYSVLLKIQNLNLMKEFLHQWYKNVFIKKLSILILSLVLLRVSIWN